MYLASFAVVRVYNTSAPIRSHSATTCTLVYRPKASRYYTAGKLHTPIRVRFASRHTTYAQLRLISP